MSFAKRQDIPTATVAGFLASMISAATENISLVHSQLLRTMSQLVANRKMLHRAIARIHHLHMSTACVCT